MLINASRSRDILECIASLSSDEVATPPAVANQVLDLLPVEVWSNKDLRWLDPACKTGVFLRETARRLMEGLKDSIPDEAERRKHIFTKMLHGHALTELTAQMSRRSLYYNKDASSKKLSVVPFKREEGNIQFSGQDHPYNTNGKCSICGAGKEVFGAPGNRERHAYDFIHSEEGDMKFDVVVGNPPYQIEDGGAGASAAPIYQHFVSQAFRLKPRYVSMIIPSRWFAGGKGLDSFRAQMLASANFRNLVDYPDAAELFPGVDIGGGVCYFLWDRDYSGPCEVKTFSNGSFGPAMKRLLGDQGTIFIRFNEAISILGKVQGQAFKPLSDLVSPIRPFGLRTFFEDYKAAPYKASIALHTSDGVKYVDRAQILNKTEVIDQHKVFLGSAYGERGSYPYWVIGKPQPAGPGAACTETYLYIGPVANAVESENLAAYLTTRFARFLIALCKNTQHLRADRFQYVPIPDLQIKWTDAALYKRYGITQEEQLFIASIVKDWTK